MKIFTYWEGEQFSFFHYMTIFSLHKLNPGIEIIVYTSKYSHNTLKQWKSTEHDINIIKKHEFKDILPMVTLCPIDFQSEYNVPNEVSIVFKADICRIVKLYEHGGMWFDMDVLFIKPIPKFVRDYIFEYSEVIPTGLIFIRENNLYINTLHEKLLEKIFIIKDWNSLDYQEFGPHLFTQYKYYNYSPYAETTDVYPYLDSEFQLLYGNDDDRIKNNTWAIHWYNGSPFSKIAINNYSSETNNIFSKYIKALI